METRKALRLRWETVYVVRDRLAHLDSAVHRLSTRKNALKPFPRPVDLAASKDLEAIIMPSPGTEYSAKAFNGILPKLIVGWRENVQAQLTDLVLSGMSPARRKKGPNPHELARVMFKCGCNKIMFWHDVAAHVHPEDTTDDDPRPVLNQTDGHIASFVKPTYETALGQHYKYKAWSVESVQLHVCGKRTAKVFEACGKDLATATVAEMEALDARFECVKCGRRGRSMLVMDWREAVSFPLQTVLRSYLLTSRFHY